MLKSLIAYKEQSKPAVELKTTNKPNYPAFKVYCFFFSILALYIITKQNLFKITDR